MADGMIADRFEGVFGTATTLANAVGLVDDEAIAAARLQLVEGVKALGHAITNPDEVAEDIIDGIKECGATSDPEEVRSCALEVSAQAIGRASGIAKVCPQPKAEIPAPGSNPHPNGRAERAPAAHMADAPDAVDASRAAPPGVGRSTQAQDGQGAPRAGHGTEPAPPNSGSAARERATASAVDARNGVDSNHSGGHLGGQDGPSGTGSPPGGERRGFVSGFREIWMKAHLAKRGTAAKYRQAAAEIRAAKHLRAQGRNVHFQTPGTVRSAEGGTADFLVDGARGTGAGGTPFDVVAPTAPLPNAVFRAVRNKNNQAKVIVIDLSNTTVTAGQLGNIMWRLGRAGATNIQEVIILP